MERVEVHVYHHFDSEQFGEVVALLRNIDRKETVIMADLTALTAAVEQSVTVEQSAIALIQGIAAQLAAAATDPAAVQALADKLNAEATALSAAVAANTPASPAPATP